jgi:hypothetical protein
MIRSHITPIRRSVSVTRRLITLISKWFTTPLIYVSLMSWSETLQKREEEMSFGIDWYLIHLEALGLAVHHGGKEE